MPSGLSSPNDIDGLSSVGLASTVASATGMPLSLTTRPAMDARVSTSVIARVAAMGIGGAPEGVLAAAALRCVGGQIQGRLLYRNEDEVARARRWGIHDLDRVYRTEDMARGDCIFAATGVTDGSLLAGVHRRKSSITTESIVMRASSGTVRRVTAEHQRTD